MSTKEKKTTTLPELIEMGKKAQNKLTSAELGSFFEDANVDPDGVDKIYETIEARGIEILDIGEEEGELLTKANIEQFEKTLPAVDLGQAVQLLKIHGAEEIYGAAHRGGFPGPLPGVEAVGVHGHPGGEMPAGGSPEGGDPAGIQVELRGICPQKAHRGLAVDDLRRPLALAAAAVVDAGHGVAGLREKYELAQHHVLVHLAPARAVDPEDHRLQTGGDLVVAAGGQAHLTVAVLQQQGHG